MRQRPTLFTLGVAFVGCSSYTASLPESDVRGSVPDAGEVGDATLRTDGPSKDAADAGSDAPDAPTFCSGKAAAFCADFDRSGYPADGWDQLAATGSGSVQLSRTDYSSAPKSAFFQLHAMAADEKVWLTKTVAANGKRHLRLSYAWKYLAYDYSSGNQAIAHVSVGENGRAQVSLVHGATTGWFLDVVPGGTSTPTAANLPSAPPAGNWNQVVLDVVFSNANGSVALQVNGVTVASKDYATSTETASTTFGVVVGMGALGPTPVVQSLVDNVVLELL